MPFRLYLLNSKREAKRNILKQHFQNLSLLKRVETKPQKRQLLVHAAVEVEKYVAEKLYLSCMQICAPFIC